MTSLETFITFPQVVRTLPLYLLMTQSKCLFIGLGYFLFIGVFMHVYLLIVLNLACLLIFKCDCILVCSYILFIPHCVKFWLLSLFEVVKGGEIILINKYLLPILYICTYSYFLLGLVSCMLSFRGSYANIINMG